MVALAVASVSSRCCVPIQETALWSRQSSKLRHGVSLRTLPQRNVGVTASSSHQNVSTTNLNEERHGEDAGKSID